MDDVEMLNREAIKGIPDITKISYAVWPVVREKYTLLDAGSALGRGVGPLLITADKMLRVLPDDMTVALPGAHTTAHMLFSYAFPGHLKKVFLRYDQIEDFVLSGKGAGVIIHENRFTYRQKGLHSITDLGNFWERQTANAIPLGGIVIRNEFPDELKSLVNELIRQSIEYARSRYPALSDFIKRNAQEMNEATMRKHIDLYVNEHSLSLGTAGVHAVKKLEEVYSMIFRDAS
jgi:1,4-dihydroxy-6-naphthoate synthase